MKQIITLSPKELEELYPETFYKGTAPMVKHDSTCEVCKYNLIVDYLQKSGNTMTRNNAEDPVYIGGWDPGIKVLRVYCSNCGIEYHPARVGLQDVDGGL